MEVELFVSGFFSGTLVALITSVAFFGWQFRLVREQHQKRHEKTLEKLYESRKFQDKWGDRVHYAIKVLEGTHKAVAIEPPPPEEKHEPNTIYVAGSKVPTNWLHWVEEDSDA